MEFASLKALSVAVCWSAVTTYLRFMALWRALCSRKVLAVKSARSRMARMMRKMQVPAYAPALAGVQASEYSGVVVDVKKNMDMPMDIEEPLLVPSMSIPAMDDMS